MGGTKYTDKVNRQMDGNDLDHNFASLIDKQVEAAKAKKLQAAMVLKEQRLNCREALMAKKETTAGLLNRIKQCVNDAEWNRKKLKNHT